MATKLFKCSVNLQLSNSDELDIHYVYVRTKNKATAVHAACQKFTLNIKDTLGISSGYIAYGGEVLDS